MSADQELELYLFPHILKMMRYAIKLLNGAVDQPREEAKDIVQDVLFATWKRWDGIEHRDDEAKLLSYVFTAIKRECWRRLKKEPVDTDVDIEDIDNILEAPESFPGSTSHVQSLELRETILSLPEPFARIIIGMDYQGKSFQEMADELGYSRERLYKLRAQALVKLERALTVPSAAPNEPGREQHLKGGEDAKS